MYFLIYWFSQSALCSCTPCSPLLTELALLHINYTCTIEQGFSEAA